MKALVKNLGDQFNIPEEELANFNMDLFVDAAIKVEAGELKSLRVGSPSSHPFLHFGEPPPSGLLSRRFLTTA